MSARDELRQRVRIAVVGASSSTREDQDEMIINAVMGLFIEVSTRVVQQDVTLISDTHEHVMYRRMIDASMVAESGSFYGIPRGLR